MSKQTLRPWFYCPRFKYRLTVANCEVKCSRKYRNECRAYCDNRPDPLVVFAEELGLEVEWFDESLLTTIPAKELLLKSLTVEEAVDVLFAIGCDNDWIQFKGSDYVVVDLLYLPDFGFTDSEEPCEVKASQVKITFQNRKTKEQRGSVLTLVKDRLEVS